MYVEFLNLVIYIERPYSVDKFAQSLLHLLLVYQVKRAGIQASSSQYPVLFSV